MVVGSLFCQTTNLEEKLTAFWNSIQRFSSSNESRYADRSTASLYARETNANIPSSAVIA
jgi:hypothetical protein